MFIIRLKNWTSITLWAQKQGFNYLCQYKDHLGNIRLSYTDVNQNTGAISLSIVEEHNYYPFGLKHKGYNANINGRHHKYMFGGKELQDEIVGSNSFEVYDFGARNYDPALGRWMNLDPLAEQMRRHTPYNYAFDNPIYFIDPDGMWPQGPIKDWLVNKASQAKQAVINKSKAIAYNAINATINFVSDVASKTKLQFKAELKNTNKIGLKVNAKGAGGLGAGYNISEESVAFTAKVNLDGSKPDASVTNDDNNDKSLTASYQVAGAGMEFKTTKKESGESSMEATVTTPTDIPLVQTETSGRTDTNGNIEELSTGISSGVELPFPAKFNSSGLDFSEGIPHLSIDLSIKLIYNSKVNEE